MIYTQIHANITGTATQGTVTGLTPYTKYTCAIYTVTGSDGPVSEPITVTTDYGGTSHLYYVIGFQKSTTLSHLTSHIFYS